MVPIGSMAQQPNGKGWKTRVISPDFLTEGLSAGDLHGDGLTDLAAGAFWCKGPDFKVTKGYRPGQAAAGQGISGGFIPELGR